MNQPLNIKIEYWTVPLPGTISFTFLNVAEQLVMLEQPKKSNTLTTGQPKLSNGVMYPVVVAFCQAVLSFFLFFFFKLYLIRDDSVMLAYKSSLFWPANVAVGSLIQAFSIVHNPNFQFYGWLRITD